MTIVQRSKHLKSSPWRDFRESCFEGGGGSSANGFDAPESIDQRVPEKISCHERGGDSGWGWGGKGWGIKE